MASWLVKRLLDLGLDVRATVRDPQDPRRTAHLSAAAEGSCGALSLCRADLLDAAGFDSAMDGCRIVIHTASPLIVRDVSWGPG